MGFGAKVMSWLPGLPSAETLPESSRNGMRALLALASGAEYFDAPRASEALQAAIRAAVADTTIPAELLEAIALAMLPEHADRLIPQMPTTARALESLSRAEGGLPGALVTVLGADRARQVVALYLLYLADSVDQDAYATISNLLEV